MSPGPSISIGTVYPNQAESSNSFNQLNVNLPSSSLMGSDDYFNGRTQASRLQTSGALRSRALDDIQTIQKHLSQVLPREPVVRAQTTDSLAEFLRNTGPA